MSTKHLYSASYNWNQAQLSSKKYDPGGLFQTLHPVTTMGTHNLHFFRRYFHPYLLRAEKKKQTLHFSHGVLSFGGPFGDIGDIQAPI